MAMILWRIVNKRFQEHALDGGGAKLYEGCWHTQGTAMVYAATSKSQALLEVLTHVNVSRPTHDYIAIPILVPNSVGGAYWTGEFQISEEQYSSGNDVGAATSACQSVFSGIGYAEYSPLLLSITIPIVGKHVDQEPSFGSIMRVDSKTCMDRHNVA